MFSPHLGQHYRKERRTENTQLGPDELRLFPQGRRNWEARDVKAHSIPQGIQKLVWIQKTCLILVRRKDQAPPASVSNQEETIFPQKSEKLDLCFSHIQDTLYLSTGPIHNRHSNGVACTRAEKPACVALQSEDAPPSLYSVPKLSSDFFIFQGWPQWSCYFAEKSQWMT